MGTSITLPRKRPEGPRGVGLSALVLFPKDTVGIGFEARDHPSRLGYDVPAWLEVKKAFDIGCDAFLES